MRKTRKVSIEEACAELGVSPVRRLLTLQETASALGYSHTTGSTTLHRLRRKGEIAGDCLLPGRGGWRFDVREVWRYAQALRAQAPRVVTS